jgi:adenylate cyclase, class 2
MSALMLLQAPGAFLDPPFEFPEMKEIEIKLRVVDRPLVLRRLVELGWRARGKRELERNSVYDKADGALRAAGCLLRVRDSAGICLLTLKLPSDEAGPHKVKEEFEIEASDCAVLGRILGGLGYRVAWRYEKYRTYFERTSASGEIVLDETPIGDFLELEGEPAWIDRTAVELGFSSWDYITATYGALFEAHRAQNSGVGTDMVFSDGVGQSDLLGS